MSTLSSDDNLYKAKIKLDNGEIMEDYDIRTISENLHEKVVGLNFDHATFKQLLSTHISKFKNLLYLSTIPDNGKISPICKDIANFIHLQTFAFYRGSFSRSHENIIAHYEIGDNFMMINCAGNFVIPEHIKNLNYTFSENIINTFYDPMLHT